jgi:hypothetical protein
VLEIVNFFVGTNLNYMMAPPPGTLARCLMLFPPKGLSTRSAAGQRDVGCPA